MRAPSQLGHPSRPTGFRRSPCSQRRTGREVRRGWCGRQQRWWTWEGPQISSSLERRLTTLLDSSRIQGDPHLALLHIHKIATACKRSEGFCVPLHVYKEIDEWTDQQQFGIASGAGLLTGNSLKLVVFCRDADGEDLAHWLEHREAACVCVPLKFSLMVCALDIVPIP